MLKAKNNNMLTDRRQRVYVQGTAIKWYSGITSMTIRKFSRKDVANAAMAHLWSVAASSKNGITRSHVLREINSIEEE